MARHPIGWMRGGWAGFGLGIAASVILEAVAPHVVKAAAPAARSALKFVFGLSDQVARSAARMKEQAEDFVAGTRAEYDAEQEAAVPGSDNRVTEPES